MLAVTQNRILIVDLRLHEIVDIDLDPKNLLAAGKLVVRFRNPPFERPGIWRMRCDCTAKRVHIVVTQVSKVTTVSPGSFIPKF